MSLEEALAQLKALKRTDTPTQPQETVSETTQTGVSVSTDTHTDALTPTPTPTPPSVGAVGFVGAPSVLAATHKKDVQNSTNPHAVGVSVQFEVSKLLTLAAQAGYPEYRIKDHWVFIPEGKEAWQRNLQAMLKTHPKDLPRVLTWLEADLRLMATAEEVIL